MEELKPCDIALLEKRLKNLSDGLREMDGNIMVNKAMLTACRDYMAELLALRRAIAAGELRPVIHAHWNYTSRPNEDCMGGSHAVIECSHCKEDYGAEYDHCPSCGAQMDESVMRQTHHGKDDSHE